MWSDHRAFLYLQAMTIRIQAKGRALVAKWKYQILKDKTLGKYFVPSFCWVPSSICHLMSFLSQTLTVVQKFARAYLGRRKYYERKYVPRKRAEKTHVSALRIQRLYRGYRGRKVGGSVWNASC